MLRYLFTLSPTEIFLFSLLGFFGLLLLYVSRLKSKPKGKPKETESKEIGNGNTSSKKSPNLQVMEVFDYNGTKILHQDGSYTVNDKGVITNHSSWDLLPPIYQKMIKELDNRSLGEKGNDYFLEMINGFYYVSLPGGKKKRYSSMNEIPAHIRKRIGL